MPNLTAGIRRLSQSKAKSQGYQTIYGQASYAGSPGLSRHAKVGITTTLTLIKYQYDEGPFWYGGVLCFTRMKNNIIRLRPPRRRPAHSISGL
jgi:hypothetical protein